MVMVIVGGWTINSHPVEGLLIFLSSSPQTVNEIIVEACAIKAYCCTARITLDSEIVLKLWVYIYQAQR
jgi:hypothetical protein